MPLNPAGGHPAEPSGQGTEPSGPQAGPRIRPRMPAARVPPAGPGGGRLVLLGTWGRAAAWTAVGRAGRHGGPPAEVQGNGGGGRGGDGCGSGMASVQRGGRGRAREWEALKSGARAGGVGGCR